MIFPQLIGRKEVVCNISSHALEFGWVRFPLANGQEKVPLHNLESCTGVWVGKSPLLLMDRRKFVCNIWSHALELGLVGLPLAMRQEKSRLQHLESCTGVWVSKTPSLLFFSRNVIYNI